MTWLWNMRVFDIDAAIYMPGAEVTELTAPAPKPPPEIPPP